MLIKGRESMTEKYVKRICDDELALKLNAFGAVHIVGPKWCGKTTTAKQFAKSFIEMQDPDKRDMYLLLYLGKSFRCLGGIYR